MLECSGYGHRVNLENSYFVKEEGVIESGTSYGGESGEKGIYMRNFIKLTRGNIGSSTATLLEIRDTNFSGAGKLTIHTLDGVFFLEKL